MNTSEPQITQTNFQETPYGDASWEIVGEPPSDQVFTPMELRVIPRAQALLDPMFADYGGTSPSSEPRRWHLTEGGTPESGTGQQSAPKEDPNLIKLMPDELEAIKAQAREEGRNEAAMQLQAQQQEQLSQIGVQLKTVLDDLRTQVDEQLAAVETAAVALAVQISERLVAHAVELNPEYIRKIVADALAAAGGAPVKAVRVSPADFEFLEVVGMGAGSSPAEVSWEFTADTSIRSGCIVETSAGEVDFQLDKAWERVRDQIMKAVA